MVNNNDFSGSQQLLRNNDTAQGIRDATASVADYMGIAFFEAKGSSGVY